MPTAFPSIESLGFLSDGEVSADAFTRSVVLVRARTVIPSKAHMPTFLGRLLLMEPLQEALRHP